MKSTSMNMMIITTRSSQLFVVLLHLLGVSTRLPSSSTLTPTFESLSPSSSSVPFNGVGIHPLTIVMETLGPSQLEPSISILSTSSSSSSLPFSSQSSSSFSSSSSTARTHASNQQIHATPNKQSSSASPPPPYWLQDILGDQLCLDPMGRFSQCGDTTMWRVIPRTSTKRLAKWRKWITWATEEEETDENTSSSRIQGYALQYYEEPTTNKAYRDNDNDDDDTYISNRHDNKISISQENNDVSSKECLSRRRRDNQLILVPCTQDRAWAWHFNELGILHFKKARSKDQRSSSSSSFLKDDSNPLSSSTSVSQQKLIRHGKKNLLCFGRNSTNTAILIPCDGNVVPSSPLSLDASLRNRGSHLVNPHIKDDEEEEVGNDTRVLQVGLVRQITEADIDRLDPMAASQNMNDRKKQRRRQSHTLTHSHVGVADSQATALPGEGIGMNGIRHMTGLSSATRAHHASSVSASSSSSSEKTGSRASSIKMDAATSKSGHGGSTLSLEYFKSVNPLLLANGHVGLRNQEQSKAEASSSTASSPSLNHMKPTIRKIQTNPYISDSVDEKWTDPLTGLVYHTDLCPYLGHDRAEAGRHTLTGVGQYMKTVFNIKVYGVALYVSKRDILADPLMEDYAILTSEELRNNPDFYTTMRFMTPSTNEHAGSFDRTLFLKTNMQLGTDTMRSSLDADWKMLTQEAKDLLIGSSMKPRPASEAMMEVIQSPDNPSKCSCAQIADEEYGADPGCCARGTELVFTWRKNGALEVRLNGALMDSFDRPDVAAAIFYEYFRLDDPMSPDFLERVVDGFPMLLGPLAQIKGVSSPAMAGSSTPSSKPSNEHNVILRAVEGVGGAVISGATGVAGFVHHGATELGTGALSAARSMGDAAKTIGEEVEQRRRLIGKHVIHFAHQTVSSVYSGSKNQKAVSTLPIWLETMPLNIQTKPTAPERRSKFQQHVESLINKVLGRSMNNKIGLSPSTDDHFFTPMLYSSTAHNTQRLFLGMVHLYLLLILIASFPATIGTRTKVITFSSRKSKLPIAIQPVSDSDSEEGSSTTSIDKCK